MDNKVNDALRLEDILNTTPTAVGWSSVSSGRIEYINKAFSELFGYDLSDISDLKTWYSHAFPELHANPHAVAPWDLVGDENRFSPDLKTKLLCKDGSVRQVGVRFSTVGDKRLWYFNDITDYWVAEERLRARSDMLEMVAKGSALKEILNVIVKQVQRESPSSLCSILLFDATEQRLRLGASPDLPEFFNQAVDGIKIGMNVGSCGTAAYLGKRVIVEDIYTHDYWKNFTALAQKARVAACWSDPIMSSKGNLLGTFAIYKRTSASPKNKDLELINFACNLVSIAIESVKAQEELEHRAYFDHLTGLGNRGYFFEQCDNILKESLMKGFPLSILMMDVDNFKSVNDAFGHKTGDLVLQKLAQVSELILRREDIIARIGGEEFAVLLPTIDKKEVLRVAERLRKAIETSMVLSMDNQKVYFTVSLGIAYKDHGYCSVDDLLSIADNALYQSKSAGRNCIFSLEYNAHNSLF